MITICERSNLNGTKVHTNPGEYQRNQLEKTIRKTFGDYEYLIDEMSVRYGKDTPMATHSYQITQVNDA